MSLSAVLVANGFPKNLSNPLHANMTIVMGTLTIFIIGFVLSAIYGKKTAANFPD
jgi:SSS family solute:Na+ symporter